MSPLLQDYKFLNKGWCETIRKNLDPLDEHRDDAKEYPWRINNQKFGWKPREGQLDLETF